MVSGAIGGLKQLFTGNRKSKTPARGATLGAQLHMNPVLDLQQSEQERCRSGMVKSSSSRMQAGTINRDPSK